MDYNQNKRKGGGAHSLAQLLRDGEATRDELPYEKFTRFGAGALTDAELLAIIIRTGAANRTPMQIGKDVLSACGGKERGLSALHHLSVGDLMKIPGIGEVKAVKLKCLSELAKRMAMERVKPDEPFLRPDAVAMRYMESMRHEDGEAIMILSLNVRMCLIREDIVAKGSVGAVPINPRDIFECALRNGAAYIIMIHNHPSGNPNPSNDDYEATKRVDESGRMIGILLADHIIIGDGRYYSFKEQKVL